MKIQLTNGMMLAFIVNLVYAKAIGLTQGIMEREVGGDLWIATLVASVQGMLIMWLTVAVIRRAPNRNLVEQVELLLGGFLAKVFCFILFVFFMGAFLSCLITFVFHMMDYFLPTIPLWIFISVALLVAVYTLWHGLEVTGRMAIVGVFSIAALNILILAGTVKDFDIRQALPILQSGVPNMLWASRHNDTDWAMATLMTGLILPLVKSPDTWGKSSVGGIFFGGVLVLMWPILELGVLSPDETGHYTVACMQLARSAEMGVFIHRYEMLMIAFFAISLIAQLTMTIFCASLCASKGLGLKDFRSSVIPVCLVFGGVGYWVASNHFRAISLLTNWWPTIALPIAIGVPLFVWIVGAIRSDTLRRATTGKAK